LGGPRSAKTKHVLINSKAFTKTCFFTAFLQCRWGCLNSKTLCKSICSTPTPTLAQHCLIIQLKMSSMPLPAASSSLPLPISLRAPPVILSLCDCFLCGSINLGKYVLYSSALRQRARWRTSLSMLFGGPGMLPFLMADNAVDADAHRVPKARMQRFVYARRDTEDGPLEIIPPEKSMWYKFYVRNFYINQDAKLAKAFCNRFRLPYPQFLELVEDIRSNNLFDQWCGYKSNNKKVLPVELLLLGLLRYLGHGWTFDDCEESTAIDKDVHRTFFCVFLEFGSTILYKKWVLTPVNLPKALSNMKEYSVAGFPGHVGSSDCTHIVTDQCEYNLKNNHLGVKNSLTTRTFNLMCNHRRRILHTTLEGPVDGMIRQWLGWILLFLGFMME
jgi:hypothetical protein